MSRALFVSDIHISSPTDPKYKLFSDLLDKCVTLEPKLDYLFLVGDIFDLWVADRDYFVDNYHHIVERLVRLKSLGTEVHYFEGNHDIDLKLYWQDKLGLKVHDSAAYFALDPMKIRVEHGDQMDPEDKGYLFLRWLLRTPVVKGMGRSLPNGLVGWIGNRASRASRDYTTNVKVASDEEVRAKIRRHAIEAYEERRFDVFISGHVHVAEDSQQKGFRCVNLGTWLKEPLLLEIKGRDIQLRKVEDFLK